MDNPFISVIIPTYNRAKTLPRAIESVQNQTYKNFEIIIVDDGSSDDTQNLLKNYSDIKVITQDNLGVSAARNNAIKTAAGDWIAFLDSDDEWLPIKLEKQVELIPSTELRVIHTEEIWIRNGERVNQMKKHQKSGGDIFNRSLSLCLMSPSSILLRKDIFDIYGMFREDFPVCEDYDLWLKITAFEEVAFIETPLIKKYGGHDDQLSRSMPAMDFFRVKSIYELLKKEISKEKKKAAKDVLRQKCAILYKGYQKHQNPKRLAYIQKIINSLNE